MIHFVNVYSMKEEQTDNLVFIVRFLQEIHPEQIIKSVN